MASLVRPEDRDDYREEDKALSRAPSKPCRLSGERIDLEGWGNAKCTQYAKREVSGGSRATTGSLLNTTSAHLVVNMQTQHSDQLQIRIFGRRIEAGRGGAVRLGMGTIPLVPVPAGEGSKNPIVRYDMNTCAYLRATYLVAILCWNE